MSRVATVREKLPKKIFQVREKSGNFVDGQGKSGNLKINGNCSLQKLIHSSKEKNVLSS